MTLPLDKQLHVGASAGLVVLGYAAARAGGAEHLASLGAAAAFSFILGVGKEARDLAGYGDPDWRDLLANLVGVAAAAGLLHLVHLVVAR